MHADLPDLGIAHDGVDPTRPETWEAARTPATRAFHVETIGNPLMGVPDLAAVVRLDQFPEDFAWPVRQRFEQVTDFSRVQANQQLPNLSGSTAVQGGAQAERHRSLELGGDRPRIDGDSAVHGDHHAVHADLATLDGHFRHLGHEAPERLVHGDAAPLTGGQR